jgi:hypothetical protein
MGFYLSFSSRFFPQSLQDRHCESGYFTASRLLPEIFKIPEHASFAGRANPMADGWEPRDFAVRLPGIQTGIKKTNKRYFFDIINK